MEFTMYDTLLQLPLFQGLCKNDFTEILGKVKLHFSKHKAMERIIEQGKPCDKLIFLLKGELVSEFRDKDNLYTWCEYFNEPFVIEPYSLFGMHTDFVASYTSVAETQLVSIDKSFVLSRLNKYEIFQLNYLNIVSNRSQVFAYRLLSEKSHSLQERIIDFFRYRSERLAGRKILKIKMEDLAWLLNDTRLSVSRILNELQENGLLLLRRKEIEVPDMARLLEYKQHL